MLHGNRIGYRAGLEIAEAIRRGMHWLPPADRAVLQRYADSTYGF